MKGKRLRICRDVLLLACLAGKGRPSLGETCMKLSTAAPESGFKSSSSLALRGEDMPSTPSSERVGNNGRDTRSPLWVTGDSSRQGCNVRCGTVRRKTYEYFR